MSKLEIPVYLASSSPRRKELLQQIGVDFHIVTPNIDESLHENESPEAYVRRMAEEKAKVGLDMIQGEGLIIGSDTSVVLDDHILGKPVDLNDAIAMLERLSGRSHRVMTAVAMINHKHHQLSRLSVNEVHFRNLT
ncbi:MAG: septum formation protein Maf, partial [Gammaproteobacteria bacterium]|nr:septum formation protein Maf [Gammaproteobacteria bacterium]